MHLHNQCIATMFESCGEIPCLLPITKLLNFDENNEIFNIAIAEVYKFGVVAMNFHAYVAL